ncbi:hypothetical protein [Fodinicola feengrottensis]|uniref:hypothetical protein n=1 Tax=Fodinicola feengrottensis TaxID=435914 RepID=UPI002442419E|nr:hypothetical protein [Fodinicola feengrottensis]
MWLRLSYVAVLVLCLIGALWLEPLLKVNVLRRWRRLVLSLLPTLILFGLWDIAAIAAGHWSYDPRAADRDRAARSAADRGAALLRDRADVRDPGV